MERKRVLIFGAGVIGGTVADLLARMDDSFSVVLAARREEAALERANLASAVAMNLGYRPQVSGVAANVRDLEPTSELVDRFRPDVIVNSTSRQTFWKISTLPERMYRSLLQARVGPWLPHHLSTARALMLAIHDSGTRAKVVNAAFPDAVNPILSKAGIAPTIGAGNIGNLIPTLRRALALHFNCEFDEIDLRMVAHHVVGNAIASYGHPDGAPFLLCVKRNGEDVSRQLDTADVFRLFLTDLRRTRGVTGQVMAASCVAMMVKAVTGEDVVSTHAPGPAGLPGGYPVDVSSSGVSVTPPAGHSLTDCIAVNEAAQRYEGIAKIESDGTVRFEHEQMAVLTREFGYRCSVMQLHDVDDWADELDARYAEYARVAAAA